MTFKSSILLIFTILLVGCCSDKNAQTLTGKYVSKNYNIIERAFMQMNNETYVLGSDLTLLSDSSYILNTCGNTIKGVWKTSNGLLLLFCLENNFKNDSINKLRPPSCGDKPSTFKIETKSSVELIDEFSHKNEKILNNMIKIDG